MSALIGGQASPLAWSNAEVVAKRVNGFRRFFFVVVGGGGMVAFDVFLRGVLGKCGVCVWWFVVKLWWNVWCFWLAGRRFFER